MWRLPYCSLANRVLLPAVFLQGFQELLLSSDQRLPLYFGKLLAVLLMLLFVALPTAENPATAAIATRKAISVYSTIPWPDSSIQKFFILRSSEGNREIHAADPAHHPKPDKRSEGDEALQRDLLCKEHRDQVDEHRDDDTDQHSRKSCRK